MVTVRARITALSLIVSSLVLVTAAVALVEVLGAQLTTSGDDAARTRVAELVVAVRRDRLAPTLEPVTDDGLVQVVSTDGTVLAGSSNLPRVAVDTPARGPEDLRVVTFRAPDDDETERYRTWRQAVETDDGVVTVLVGTSLESVAEATATLRTTLYVGVPLMLVLLGLGTWHVVGRSLARVDRIRQDVDAIHEDDLARRLEPGPDDEVGRLVETMNGLIARLERAQVQQRAFVADASHELQSPITALRAQLEVASAHPDGTDWAGLVADLLEDTDRMEDLVRDLLLLAVGESPLADTGRLVALDEIVSQEVRRLVHRDGVVVDVMTEPFVQVVGDPGQLARIVRNLVENAVGHATSRVHVRLDVHVDVTGPEAVVRVQDDGPGVPEEQADLVFERFFRGDAARSRASRGTGLGLAIARTLARRHGGDVELVTGTVGACFLLRLPARQPPS